MTAESAVEDVGALVAEAAAATERASASIDPLWDDSEWDILWHSNAPWASTGYGSQTALFAPLLQEQLGYRLAFSAFWGLKGSRLGWQSPRGTPFVIYPAHRDGYGNDVLGTHAKHWFRDPAKGIVILLTDPWVMNPKMMSRLQTLAWVPVDHDPLMPRTDDWFKKSEAVPLAMSRFGEEVLREAGHKKVWYVPHGFNSEIFYPTDRAATRAQLRLPESAFIVTMVAANRGWPSRKGFAQAIPAFAAFKEKHPEALLYLHTKMEESDGEALHELCEACGVQPILAHQYGLALGTPPQVVAAVMNASDVLLNPSHGEGFGVPLVEAQACGTPVIATNFSSMPEVAPVEVGNWMVDGQKTWTAFNSWQIAPSIDAIVAALESAYAEPEQGRLDRRISVARWALSEYEVDHVVRAHWEPVLHEVIHEFKFRWERMTPL